MDTLTGANDNFEGLRPQFTGATQQFEKGGEVEYPNKGLEALAKIAPDVVNKMGYANGGMVEVEGGEAFETPNGEVGEFVGPDHSEGGIKMEVGDKNDNMV